MFPVSSYKLITELFIEIRLVQTLTKECKDDNEKDCFLNTYTVTVIISDENLP